MTTALVFGAGGARGAFEIGAAQYLFDVLGVDPEIVAGASVGSLIAAKIAEGQTRAERVRALIEMKDFLSSLHSFDEFFVPRPWLREFRGTSVGREVERRFVGGVNSVSHESFLSHVATIGRGILNTLIHDAPRLHRAFDDLVEDGSSLLSLEPLRARLSGDDGVPGLLDGAAIAESGVTLRMAVVCLDSGDLRYVSEDGRLLDRNGVALEDHDAVDVIDGTLASAAQPLLFPPVELDGEAYSDGGIVTLVPLEIVIAAGATEVFVVVATAIELTPPPSRGFARANLISLYRRTSNDIPLWENLRRSLDPPNRADAEIVTIAPTVDLIGVTQIDPGLIAIASDYGFMRAADVIADRGGRLDSTAVTTLADSIGLLRRRAWEFEAEVLDESVDESIRRYGLAALKWAVMATVDARCELGLAVPAGAQDWHQKWERGATYAQAIDRSAIDLAEVVGHFEPSNVIFRESGGAKSQSSEPNKTFVLIGGAAIEFGNEEVAIRLGYRPDIVELPAGALTGLPRRPAGVAIRAESGSDILLCDSGELCRTLPGEDLGMHAWIVPDAVLESIVES